MRHKNQGRHSRRVRNLRGVTVRAEATTPPQGNENDRHAPTRGTGVRRSLGLVSYGRLGLGGVVCVAILWLSALSACGGANKPSRGTLAQPQDHLKEAQEKLKASAHRLKESATAANNDGHAKKRFAEAGKVLNEALDAVRTADKNFTGEQAKLEAGLKELEAREEKLAMGKAALLAEALEKAKQNAEEAARQFGEARVAADMAEKATLAAQAGADAEQLRLKAVKARKTADEALNEYERREAVTVLLAKLVADASEVSNLVAAEQAAENAKKTEAEQNNDVLKTLGAGPALIVGVLDATRNAELDDHQFQARFGLEVHFSPWSLSPKLITNRRPSSIAPNESIVEYLELRTWDVGVLTALYGLTDDEISGLLGLVFTRRISKIGDLDKSIFDGTDKRLMNLGIGLLLDREDGSTRLGVGLCFSAGLGLLSF